MYLLVGGYGFLGANLARYIASLGEEACILTRRSSIRKRRILSRAFSSKRIKLMAYDKIGMRELVNALEKCKPSYIYYLAGAINGSRERIWEAHVGLWSKLLKVLVGRDISLVIYTSSISAMGDASNCIIDSNLVIEEDEHLRGCQPRGFYEESKAEGERVGLKYYKEKDVPVAIVRPVAIYGPYGYHIEWKLIYKLARHGVIIDLDIPVVYSMDVAKAMFFLSEKHLIARGSWFIVAPPKHLTISMLSKRISEKTSGAARVKLKIPRLAILLASLAPRSYRAKQLLRTLKRKYHYKPQRLLALGFTEWTSFEEALKETLAWMKMVWGR